MRKELKKIDGERKEFIGEFSRIGTKNNYIGVTKTVLLLNITDIGGNKISDHLWFNYTKGFESIDDLNEGDKIKFTARVKKYEKGYKGNRMDIYSSIETDYKLSHPSKIEKIDKDKINE